MEIHELTSQTSGVDKTSSTIRFKLADDTNINSSDPLTIPTSGVTRSYTKSVRMYCATAPDTQITNLRMYPDAANNFGASIDVVATNIGTTFSANATAALTNATDLWNYSSATPIDMDAVYATAVTATGYCGDIIKLQMEVRPGASPGSLTAETITVAYDEI